METLGQFLKREREFRGVSLEKLADETRINHRVLKGLEDDALRGAPQEIYLRGFLRTYARQVGLNVDEVLARYESERGERKSVDLGALPSAGLRIAAGGWRHPLSGETGTLPLDGDDSSRWLQVVLAIAVVGGLVALAAILSTR